MTRNLKLLIILLFASTSNINAQNNTNIVPKREFRGVWVATVSNIDWPSKPGLTVEQQKDELLTLLTQHQKNGMNAIMLQIRPAADAFYAKSREPWSQWLMGKQGIAPSSGYDPLAFAIKECHSRAMELHAWFNPYRASMSAGSYFSPDHMTQKRPDLFFTYGGKKQFDPGLPEVREYIVQVILDVVKGYDVDGIHFDDYFYPYKIAGQQINDAATFAKYANGFTNVANWRRNNVDVLIKNLTDSIHFYKKHIKFGISPFGIWRNFREDTLGSKTNGLSNFEELYADSRKWVKEGWVDYINPQVYFSFERTAAPFATLVNWWSNNSFGRHLYIGQAAYLLNISREIPWRQQAQLPNQVKYLRTNNRVQGSVFFSSKSFVTNAKGFADSLKNNLYKYPALPPQMPWLDEIIPNTPQQFNAEVLVDGVRLKWEKPLKAIDNETASGYVIYRFTDGEKITVLNAKNILKISFEYHSTFTDLTAQKGVKYSYLITALDRLKNESEPSQPVVAEVK
jgi:uncharacterized lipoprotein YddW (UPF0748 family)